MGLSTLLSHIHGRFTTRIFLYLLVSMFLVFGLYNLLNWQLQKKGMEKEVIKDGKILCQFLADNIKLGVFAEDRDQIVAASEGIANVDGVRKVCILNQDLGILNQYTTGKNDANIQKYKCMLENENHDDFFSEVRRSRSAHFADHGNYIEFWAPVVIDPVSFSDDSLFFNIEESRPKSSQIIGYVGIVLDKTTQVKENLAMLIKNISFSVIFLIISGIITYLIIREASLPINKLIENVKEFGIELNTDDEVGMLASTFDNLVGKLSDAFATINELKTDLEKKVEARTGELSRANQDLMAHHHTLKEKNQQLEEAMHRLQETQVQLVQSEKMVALGQLVAGVAHEVNNTINFISGALPPLNKTINDFKQLVNCYDNAIASGSSKDFSKKIELVTTCRAALDYETLNANLDILIANIGEGVKRTSKIVRDLKKFSRPDDDQLKEIDVHESIDITLDLLYTEYKYDIEIVRNFDVNLPAISCYPGQLSQVFMNILLNCIHAIKFMPGSKGTIKISTFKDNGFLHVSFKDTGCGMNEEILAKIFDPFFTTKEVGKGTGLGLSISYGIIKKHNGEILVRSSMGEGSEFDIILPFKQTPS